MFQFEVRSVKKCLQVIFNHYWQVLLIDTREASLTNIRQILSHFSSSAMPCEFPQSLLHEKWVCASSSSCNGKVRPLTCEFIKTVATGHTGSWGPSGPQPTLGLLKPCSRTARTPDTWQLLSLSLSVSLWSVPLLSSVGGPPASTWQPQHLHDDNYHQW